MVLFYPTNDAVELDKALVMQERTPIQLVVPDGTWRQARKIHSRHPELKDLPRVKTTRRITRHFSCALKVGQRHGHLTGHSSWPCGY